MRQPSSVFTTVEGRSIEAPDAEAASAAASERTKIAFSGEESAGGSFIAKDRLCFLLVGDLSFFYDMNSIWNKPLHGNMRILMVNNNGSGLLRGHRLKGVTSKHDTEARGWVESTGFKYMSAHDREEYEEKLASFIDPDGAEPLFFEVFCD